MREKPLQHQGYCQHPTHHFGILCPGRRLAQIGSAKVLTVIAMLVTPPLIGALLG
jgi:hypothetical protein